MEPEQQYYWELELKSGEVVDIKPDAASRVQKAMAEKRPLTMTHRSIPFSEIKDFRIGSKRYTDQKLLEGAAGAFKEPILTETVVELNGKPYVYHGVKAKWVKTTVPRRKWESYFSKLSGNRLIWSDEKFVTYATVLPVHNINYENWQDLTEEEELNLSRKEG